MSTNSENNVNLNEPLIRIRVKRNLTWIQACSFGVGHVLNDLCHSMWYSYFLVYLLFAKQIPSVTAGIIMAIAIFSDALFTPLVAYESDRGFLSGLVCAYGKRKSMNLVGTILVAISFPLQFLSVDGFTPYLAYLISMTLIYELGWSCAQISHISMIPQLTPHSFERDELNIYRFSGDIAGDITIYVITYFVFTSPLADNFPPAARNDPVVDQFDSSKFLIIALIVTGIGIVCSVIYHIFTPEVKNYSNGSSRAPTPHFVNISQNESLKNDENVEKLPSYGSTEDFEKMGRSISAASNFSNISSKSWKEWTCESGPRFYQVGLLFILAKLFANLTTTLLPLYVTEGFYGNYQVYLALIPLVYNSSIIVSSLPTKLISNLIGKRKTGILGLLITLSGSVWLSIASQHFIFDSSSIFPIVILMGAGGGMFLVTCLNFTSDLIGESTDSASFVYGSFVFIEKLLNGTLILLVQFFYVDCDAGSDINIDCSYYKKILSYSCIGISFVGLLTLFTLRKKITIEIMNP